MRRAQSSCVKDSTRCRCASSPRLSVIRRHRFICISQSRDAIGHALCVEGHAQLLAALHAHDDVTKPSEHLKAMAHAYVAFGQAHPEVYRLIFMQNPAYTDAAFNDAASAGETALSLFTEALALSGSPPAAAETLWAALHGIVSLSLSAAAVFAYAD